jgi:hypothetical protein
MTQLGMTTAELAQGSEKGREEAFPIGKDFFFVDRIGRPSETHRSVFLNKVRLHMIELFGLVIAYSASIRIMQPIAGRLEHTG